MARDYAKMIGALLANAEDETLSEEARSAYRNKAEKLMREYRIDEEAAIASEGTSAVPVSDMLVVMEHSAYGNPLRTYYWDMLSRIATHCGIRINGKYLGSRSGDDSRLEATLVGYEGDIRYAELLYTAARLVFLTRIDTRVDRSLSDQENCYYMRGSGMSRKAIATALWGSEPTDGAAHGKVQKLYMAECAKREETPKVSGRGIQVDIYRKAYAEGFVNQLGYRLRAAAEAVNKESGGLVLHGRQERVDEAFYQMFPHQRPMSDEEYARILREAEEAVANCQGCKRTKHRSGKCEIHRPRYMSASDYRRYQRQHESAEARAGMRAGGQAANDVHIGRAGTEKPKAAGGAERTALGS
jgi:hypothetical protein